MSLRKPRNMCGINCPITMFNDKDAGEDLEGFNENDAKAKAADLLPYTKKTLSDIGTDLDEEEILTWLNCDDSPVVQQRTDSKLIEAVLLHRSINSDDSDEDHILRRLPWRG